MATQTKDKPSYKEQAKVAVSKDTRESAQVDALASQLEQQDKARKESGTLDSQELSARAAHSAEGGGAWSEDALRKRFLEPAGPVVAYAPEQNYTSHES